MSESVRRQPGSSVNIIEIQMVEFASLDEFPRCEKISKFLKRLPKIMKIKVAYIEEPPFYWTAQDGSVTGSDIELADVVLRAIGATEIEYVPTSFEEFLPGVQEGRWDMNVPIFISAERSEHVQFSRPVWALVDGFVVPTGNPKGLTGYGSVAADPNTRLGVVAKTVQIGSAKSAGVNDNQIVLFKDQAAAIAALLAGEIDAYAATSVGNRALVEGNAQLEAVAHKPGKGAEVPTGGFSFSKENQDLYQAVNKELSQYLGSADHRARMAKFGVMNAEIDSVVVGNKS
jgi:polar amino acid transport system substrate-binding protein